MVTLVLIHLKTLTFDPNLYIDTMGWDPGYCRISYTKTLKDMEKSKNRVFPLRVRGVFEFTSAVATGTSKALAGQLSPQEALDEVAKETTWSSWIFSIRY